MQIFSTSLKRRLTPQLAVELIAEVNQPRRLGVRMRTPLPRMACRFLEETLAWCAEVRSRQTGLHLLLGGRRAAAGRVRRGQELLHLPVEPAAVLRGAARPGDAGLGSAATRPQGAARRS
ncbi:hypothetical protein FRACA_950012 [Frankia canadensis]|uniref:Uncharacterized protein n=1 Tax=Frankia canadensis TaxID=1836972 RepID=A0A2I2L2N7_9ACTN|nr:hypothetical protein FRACA_950012 [Frankia canadensis]SOU59483.1 hypothetical protein FRACA_950012 [Frankia canadensis]